MQLHFEPDREIVDLQDMASQNCFWLLFWSSTTFASFRFTDGRDCMQQVAPWQEQTLSVSVFPHRQVCHFTLVYE